MRSNILLKHIFSAASDLPEEAPPRTRVKGVHMFVKLNVIQMG